MAYYFKLDESVEDSIIRVAREQIGKAIDEIEDDELDRHQTVHQVRKRCKKLRGLMRAVRPALGKTYKKENARFRNAAKSLSYVRDAQSLLECLDDLTGHFEDEVGAGFASGVRARLVERRQRVADDEIGLDERLDQFLVTMQKSYSRVGNWKLSEEGFDAVAGGLHKTYKRGYKAMNKAYVKPDGERFHEWRKRTKYHWYHLRLLRPVWKPVVKKLCSEADDLSDLLGDEHDLAVLCDTLLEDPVAFGDKTELEALLGLVSRRRLELQQEARLLGDRVFAEAPDALVDRFGAYWAAWEMGREIEPGITPRVAAG
jgi:CHAD domain-containing protein